ncbi:retrovirus-related pol polyprotein from transposon TNT 1-94 [Tanacetum coccineum]|uniref:Retrovirus-related pol polyprotein from transposon TNT 1-94 n=1 Tax=Tanacetum coccineum TaxID=301880 RepID=A0ABQ5DVU0_9ASTR
MSCDVSWKSKLSTLNDENVLLQTQVASVVQERENIKLEFQKLFNSIKATRSQNQKEVDELIENVNQKTYTYADVRAQNQDLLMTISELKNMLRTIKKGKNVNTKFDEFETLGKLVCVTPFNKTLANKTKNVSNTKVPSDRSKPITSQSTPKTEQSRQNNENVIARGMYKITKQETKTSDSKANINDSNSTGVESSNSVRRPNSKDTKLKNKVLKNTKRSSTYVWKTSSSASIDSNKCEPKDSNVCQTNACVSNSKTVNAYVTVVNDCSNIVYISCGKDVFLHSHEKCVARHALSRNSSVKKALYGLKQASRAWYDKLSSFLIEHHFTKGIVDLTLFTRRHGDDILLVQIYVDDIIFGSTKPVFAKRFEKLMKDNFEMSMIGEMKFFLRLQVHQSPRGIFISQSQYTIDLLTKHEMEKCDTVSTPMATTKLDVDLQGTLVDQTKCRSMIGGLMYLTSSRPDIPFATFVCARYQAQPTEKHLKEVKRIFRYLRQNMGLWYSKDYGFELIAYSDADHAGCNDDFKSTSGGIQFLGDKLVNWSSKKQDCTTMSTSEAEYVSLSACYAQVIWMRTQLLDYGFCYNKILIYCDSKSAMAISCNPVQHSRTEHSNIRYHFIKEHVEKGTIELYFVGTEYNLLIFLQKPFQRKGLSI